MIGVDYCRSIRSRSCTATPVACSTGSARSVRAARRSAAALKLAIDTIQAKAIKIAAHQWEANPDDLDYKDGKIAVKGDPSKTMTTAEAGFLAFMGDKLPADLEPGL